MTSVRQIIIGARPELLNCSLGLGGRVMVIGLGMRNRKVKSSDSLTARWRVI